MDFGRLITAMVTPLDDQQRVNWDAVEPLIDYLIDEQKSDALVINGTTGESPTTTEEEKLRLVEIAVRHAKGRAKIIAGTGSNDTAHAIHLSRRTAQLGVDALLLVAPYYNKPSQEGLYQHFKAVAEAVDVPIMLYNVPGRTGVNISAATTIRLSKIPNIVATKDCTDTDQLTELLNGIEPGFTVYSGEDAVTLPVLSIGVHGIVSVASHVVGKQMKAMIEAYLNGDVQSAAALHRELHPVFKGLFCAPSPAPVKHALKVKGVDAGGVRLPLVPLTEQEAKFVESLLK
ncbi:dihydrodipicolinate synthase [Gordoniibacillus kamchatkensis]|uniref:4-hydroxy-tetrahydrodipicolinate synthase n=1 Tax=Gordoniibacillus kamchatkensis TaxID=1590651 RepID=A0ABR5AKE8_9BACL|nr:4-hydroxy-tetrahydrodipicolinate synthase [Paenibacillus sp. VKM B-2647]KIL41392.1 dihydrodipicolinate synthase [Paenibacillus sp. VKM B-2647]